jgi:hypothetical protein
MQFICDAPEQTSWFKIETDGEAFTESQTMGHAVEKHFRQAWDAAAATYRSTASKAIEHNIGLKDYVQRTMPVFLTLRDAQGTGLATAMLPPSGRDGSAFQIVIVGPGNTDPYPDHGAAIQTLGEHMGFTLDRDRCYPYSGGRPSSR